MAKVDSAAIAVLKALFETGDTLLQGSFEEIMDAIAEAAEAHGHVSTGGDASGTGDASFVVNLQSGVAGAKPGTPAVGDVYIETDTSKVYVCNTAESWTEIVGATDPKAHKASHAGGGSDKLKHTRQVLFYDPTDPIATGIDKLATIVYRGPTLTLVRWDFRAKTAPVDAAMIFDVNVAGTSLWASNQGNRPTIADGANSGTGTAFDTTTLSDGDVLTLDYDQIGSGTAGGQVTLILEGECNPEAD